MSDKLHINPASPDAMVLRMMAGSKWGPGATLTLPSGKVVTGTEMALWLDALDQPEERKS